MTTGGMEGSREWNTNDHPNIARHSSLSEPMFSRYNIIGTIRVYIMLVQYVFFVAVALVKGERPPDAVPHPQPTRFVGSMIALPLLNDYLHVSSQRDGLDCV